MDSNLNTNELKVFWILNRISGFGIQTFKRLQSEIRDWSELLNPEFLSEFRSKYDLGKPFEHEFADLLNNCAFEQEMDECTEKDIQILALTDPYYPKRLLQIYDPPIIIYVKGQIVPEDEMAVAIVGTRHPSVYGIRMAGKFGRELAEKGITIVSGLARGIDGEAHRGALMVRGRTVAVLGSGLDIIYPKEHKKLFDEICERGAVFSELGPGTEPAAFHFPRRNRLISGLSLGVLVVEASQKSGSLITASCASDEGREVYVVPGPIDSITSFGTNDLIKKGAKLVTSVDDMIEDLKPQIRAGLQVLEEKNDLSSHSTDDKQPPTTEMHQHSESPHPIVDLLLSNPLSFDEIVNALNVNPSQLRLDLLELEMSGRIRKDFGGQYVSSRVVTRT